MSNELDVAQLMTLAEAIAAIDTVPAEPHVDFVPLTRAVGRRLAADLITDRDYPPFDKSLMDGFVVRAGEAAGAFELVGEIAAGTRWAGAPLVGRQAVAIMTGAPVPPCDGEIAIVPVEHARRDSETVHLDLAPEPDKWIAKQGDEVLEGMPLLDLGTILSTQHIAALATVGFTELPIYSPPRCAVIATGNEVVSNDELPSTSQIRDANTPMLVALLNRLGFDAYDAGHVGDDAAAIRRKLCDQFAFEHPSDFDPQPDPNLPEVIFLTGGVSMGAHDHVWKAIDELTDVKIAKLRIRPGKPFVFGLRESRWTPPEPMTVDGGEHGGDNETFDQYVFGLPGNPVSAFVCTIVLAHRLLTRLNGGHVSECDDRFIELPLADTVKANGPRTFFQPAMLDNGLVVPLAWRGSADVFTLADADALIERPENDPARRAGNVVRVLPLPSSNL